MHTLCHVHAFTESGEHAWAEMTDKAGVHGLDSETRQASAAAASSSQHLQSLSCDGLVVQALQAMLPAA